MTPLTRILSDERTRAALEARFWPKVRKGDDAECWPWVAVAKHPYGYGRMTAGRGVNLKAHQIAWALKNGPIPSGLYILHRCDNPCCCNPSHLSAGTQVDNMSDARQKGRASTPPVRWGMDHHAAKLSDRDIEIIRDDRRPATQVAADYGISTKTVYRVRWGIRR